MKDITPQQFEQFLQESTCLIPFWNDEFYSEEGKMLVTEFMHYFELEHVDCAASYLRAQGTSEIVKTRVLYKIDPRFKAHVDRWVQNTK